MCLATILAEEHFFHLPKPKLSLAEQAFRYSGSALFNLLPSGIQNPESLTSFKFNQLIPTIFKF